MGPPSQLNQMSALLERMKLERDQALLKAEAAERKAASTTQAQQSPASTYEELSARLKRAQKDLHECNAAGNQP